MKLSLGAVIPLFTTIVLFAPPGSPPAVVDTLGSETEVGEGTGWGRNPSSTAAAEVALVEGPATPPLGRGSLTISVPTPADIGLAFAVPTGAPGQPLPTPVPWSGLSASYATYIETGQSPSSTPTLRMVGFQALPGTGFTTLSFQPDRNGTVVPGEWQTWEIGPDSIVFQSNQTDGFCTISNACTLSEFAAQYPNGAWGQVQLGIGSGAPAGAFGFADAVLVRDGTTAEYFYDFEVPASAASTASIAPGAATATGGSAEISLVASAMAALQTVPFTITATLPDGSVQTQVVEVAAGTTGPLSIPVPFGTTHVVVTAQGVVIAESDVTFAAPVPPGAGAPAPGPGAGEELPPTGADPVVAAWGAALLMAGLVAVAAARVRSRRVRSRSGEGERID